MNMIMKCKNFAFKGYRHQAESKFYSVGVKKYVANKCSTDMTRHQVYVRMANVHKYVEVILLFSQKCKYAQIM